MRPGIVSIERLERRHLLAVDPMQVGLVFVDVSGGNAQTGGAQARTGGKSGNIFLEANADQDTGNRGPRQERRHQRFGLSHHQ